MPSPIGHALAGCAVVWGADLLDRHPSSVRLTATCAVLAAAPDLDLVVPRYHRTATHSIAASVIVVIIAAAVTGQVSRLRAKRWRTPLICGAAYASHLLLDWLGADQFAPAGIQLLWPFSHTFFISGWDIFDQTERRHLLVAATLDQNVRAVIKEIAYVAPIAAALWLVRVKTVTRLPSQLAGRHHPPE